MVIWKVWDELVLVPPASSTSTRVMSAEPLTLGAGV